MTRHAAEQVVRAGAVEAACRVLMLAQLPPPVHGVTVTTARVLAMLDGDPANRIERLWGGSARSLDDVERRTAAKLLGFAALNLRLAAHLVTGRRFDICYVTFAPLTHAALRDALLAWWGKRLAGRTLVHLHGEGIGRILAGEGRAEALMRRLVRGTELVTITADAAGAATASGLFSRVARLPNTAPDPGPPDIQPVPPLRIGYLGNLDPRKGVLCFVDTVARLIAEGMPIEAHIAGGTTPFLSVETLKAHVDALGLCEHVTVHGPVHAEAKLQLLASLDTFVYPSRHDHAPLVLIEALSHGLVPIVIDTGGIAEIVGPDFATHVLPSSMPDDAVVVRIVELLGAYLADPAQLRRDRETARARYLAEYTERRFQDRLTSLAALPPIKRRPAISHRTALAPAVRSHGAQVRFPAPAVVKTAAFAAIRQLHVRFARRPLPDRLAVCFHALEPPDCTALAASVGALRDLGYRTVAMDEYTAPSTSGRVVNISFDDNYASWHAALGLLDRLALRATFYVNTLPFRDRGTPAQIAAYQERIGCAGPAAPRPLSTLELKEMAREGHEIACHSHSHHVLSQLPRDRWEDEIVMPKAILEALVGREVRHFSWPYGMPRHITPEQQAFCLAAGYQTIAAATPAMLHQAPLDVRSIPRSGWRVGAGVADNLVDLAIDGRLFTRLTGRAATG